MFYEIANSFPVSDCGLPQSFPSAVITERTRNNDCSSYFNVDNIVSNMPDQLFHSDQVGIYQFLHRLFAVLRTYFSIKTGAMFECASSVK